MKKLLFASAFLFLSITSFSQNFESKHFTIQKISDGVWAAIAKSGGYAICNAGIIDLGSFVMVVDPFLSTEAAEDLKKAVQQLTGDPVKYVVNTHFHNDHIGGNQVFKNASIISTENSRNLMESNKEKNFDEYKNVAPIKLDELKKKNTTKMSARELDDHKIMTGYYEAMTRAGDSVKTFLPDVTFIDRLVIYGSDKRVLLMSYGSGHTESDMFVFIPSEQIAFLGDILYVQSNPLLSDGSSDKWETYLNNIEGLNMKTLVPGHGPVGGVSDLQALKSYFKNINETAKSYVKNGKSPQDDASLKAPAPFDTWALNDYYKINVISEYKKLSQKE